MALLGEVPDGAASVAPGSGPVRTFRPIEPVDGYQPIRDHGLIGNGATAALVGRDGSIPWLCIPRFDADPIFAGILDRELGGSFEIDAGPIVGAHHRYLGDSAVLITELRVADGLVRITDLMPFRTGADLNEEAAADTGELLRCVEVLEGRVEICARISVRGGATARAVEGGILMEMPRFPHIDLVIECSRHLNGLSGRWTLNVGESVSFCLRWNGGTGASSVDSPVAAVVDTVEGWLEWLRDFRYRGPQRELVRRSAITLKLLDYLPNGAMVAAPTSSLPEDIGGERNWDYRYVWVRDAAFTVNALRRIGLVAEAEQYLLWVLRTFREERINVMYTLDGDPHIPERLDPELSGYRGSRPVRWGNGAADQIQHDVYGEILDCAFQWTNHGGVMSDTLWQQLRGLIERATERWSRPDAGIWEVRVPGFVQTYSMGMCQVALDRGAQMARRFGLEGDVDRWETVAKDIQETILRDSWDEDGQFIAQGVGDRALDAAVLSLAIRRVVPATHPRMVATINAIERVLGAGDDLLYRYLPAMSPDGLRGDEGAFLLCSFWLVDNLVLQGRLDEALVRFDHLCARVNDLGLLPEEIDPRSGEFLGNFPQAFSHVGLISSGVNLERAMQGAKTETP